uniref:Uncharacterized protein n=1 Tax=Canis lupus familiaris TaxID=9615 RepID=A0A8C0Z3R9_CANLF
MILHHIFVFIFDKLHRNISRKGWTETETQDLLLCFHWGKKRKEIILAFLASLENEKWDSTYMKHLEHNYLRFIHVMKKKFLQISAWTIVQAQLCKIFFFLNYIYDLQN